MSADLRTEILAKMSGSSKDKPLTLDALRNATAKQCKDIDDLDDMLDELLNARLISQVNGYSHGEPFCHYWLNGAVQTSPFLTGTGAPAPAPGLLSKVQPNTSISPEKIFDIPVFLRDQTNLKKENNVSLQKKPSAGLGQIITDIINANPGIDLNKLHAAVAAKVPGTALKQVTDMTYYLHSQQKIERRGRGKDATCHPYGGKPEIITPAKKAASVPKPIVANKATKPAKANAPFDANAPASKVAPASRSKTTLECAFHVGGILRISKGEHVIVLDPDEALSLMHFANHQLAYAEHLGDQP